MITVLKLMPNITRNVWLSIKFPRLQMPQRLINKAYGTLGEDFVTYSLA